LAQSSGDATQAAQGDTDEVAFWGHPFSVGLANPMPANTQFPSGEENPGLGNTGSCNSVATVPSNPATGPVQDCQQASFNKLELFSTAGSIDVENRAEGLQQGTYSQLHNERGQTKHVLLDTSKDLTAQAHLTWDSHGWVVGLGTRTAPTT